MVMKLDGVGLERNKELGLSAAKTSSHFLRDQKEYAPGKERDMQNRNYCGSRCHDVVPQHCEQRRPTREFVNDPFFSDF